MYGQWIGRYYGKNNGLAVIDIDDDDDVYRGTAYIFDDNPILPFHIARFVTKDKSNTSSINANLGILDRDTNRIISEFEAKDKYKGVNIPKNIQFSMELIQNRLNIVWKTDIGTNGEVSLPRSQADNQSQFVSNIYNDWDEFRSYALSSKPGNFIFRGQSNAYRLRTSFHRTKRKDLIKYLEVDIPNLHRSLAPRTKHSFNLKDGNDNGAFWNLLQHHGYPTPLLDWSYSPFVAAYFAFQVGPTRRRPDDTVRIFMFDATSWRSKYQQIQMVGYTRPHFSILDIYPFENDRFAPQHALSVLTNTDDVESHIKASEQEQSIRFMRVFDIPYAQREKVLNELEMMGITYGALFPGLDGLCSDMRTRFFGRDD